MYKIIFIKKALPINDSAIVVNPVGVILFS
jgi:hypothetical protein